jgi:hypothetical protein
MRKDQYFRIILNDFINPEHLCFHDRADGAAGSEEKIGNVNFVLEGLVRDNSTVLVDKREFVNGVINSICTLDLPFSKDRKPFF